MALVLLLLLLAGPAGSDGSSKIPPEKSLIRFSTPAGIVVFRHEEHATRYEVACEKCHHTIQGKSQEPPRACSLCHLNAESPRMPSLRNAVHKTCWDCHKEQRSKGKKAPVQSDCNGCHTKSPV